MGRSRTRAVCDQESSLFSHYTTTTTSGTTSSHSTTNPPSPLHPHRSSVPSIQETPTTARSDHLPLLTLSLRSSSQSHIQSRPPFPFARAPTTSTVRHSSSSHPQSKAKPLGINNQAKAITTVKKAAFLNINADTNFSPFSREESE